MKVKLSEGTLSHLRQVTEKCKCHGLTEADAAWALLDFLPAGQGVLLSADQFSLLARAAILGLDLVEDYQEQVSKSVKTN